MNRNLLLFIFIIFVCKDIYSQDPALQINIIQRILPGPNPDVVYQITGNRFYIYHVKTWKADKKVRIFAKRLSQIDLDSLTSKINISKINELSNNYSGNSLDGINWTFKLKLEKFQKEVYLDNYYLPELDVILTELNKRLPNKYREINFNYFNIKNEYLEKNKR